MLDNTELEYKQMIYYEHTRSFSSDDISELKILLNNLN